jgi:S1-C subfamily serine protease
MVALPATAELSASIGRVKPSIVMVGSHHPSSSPQFSLYGTGFAVAGGFVVTNAHVVSAARNSPEGSSLAVRTTSGNGDAGPVRIAKLHASDPTHDLAVLTVEGSPLTGLEIGDSEAVREGMDVAFTGFPIGAALGYSPVTHRGIVSAITSIAPPSVSAQGLNERAIRAIKAGPFPVFQLDATAYPGNSGGPLFDPRNGTVVGIINMVFVKSSKESALSQPSGITYAIPARYLAAMLPEILVGTAATPQK